MFALAASRRGSWRWRTFSSATGEWIIARRRAAHGPVQPFDAGRAVVAHEWLSEVLITLAFRLGGWRASYF